MLFIAALIVLAGAATTPPSKAAATPPQEKIEVRLRKKVPEGTQLEVRGSFVVTVDFFEKQGAVEGNPPAITQVRIEIPEKAASAPKLTTSVSIAESVPAPRESPMHPSSIAARLRALAAAMPKRVWLANYAETNGAITIEGSGVMAEDIAELMRALAAAPPFKDVVLVSAEAAPDRASMRFKLTAAAK